MTCLYHSLDMMSVVGRCLSCDASIVCMEFQGCRINLSTSAQLWLSTFAAFESFSCQDNMRSIKDLETAPLKIIFWSPKRSTSVITRINYRNVMRSKLLWPRVDMSRWVHRANKVIHCRCASTWAQAWSPLQLEFPNPVSVSQVFSCDIFCMAWSASLYWKIWVKL